MEKNYIVALTESSNSSTDVGSLIRLINMPKYRVTDQKFFTNNNILEDLVVKSIEGL